MKYQIRFIAGELSGRIFPLDANAISIGRSRSGEIKLSAPDVSGRHVMLIPTSNGIELENLSSRFTAVDGSVIAPADRRELVAGQTISLGTEVKFVLEAIPGDSAAVTEIPTAPPGVSGDEIATAAALPAASGDETGTVAALPAAPLYPPPAKIPAKSVEPPLPDSENQTVAMPTRMVSPEELEYLRNDHQRKQTRKIVTSVAAGLAAIGFLIFCYYSFVHRTPERWVSWPKDKAGNELAADMELDGCPLMGDIVLEYPDPARARVKRSPGEIVIETALGKYRDVPLRMTLEYKRDENSLRMDRTAAFEAWISGKAREQGHWNFDLIRPVGFYQWDHGIPYLSVSYSRTVNGGSYFGIATFLRYADWTFVLAREVPTRERWRAEPFLQQVPFLGFSPKFLRCHWEGMSNIQSGSALEHIDEAKALLLRRSPSVWEKADYLLRSALCKLGTGSGSQEDANTALQLLESLRANQVEWFNAQKIAFLVAENRGQKDEMNRIRETLKAVFSSSEDARYHKVRQGKWD